MMPTAGRPPRRRDKSPGPRRSRSRRCRSSTRAIASEAWKSAPTIATTPTRPMSSPSNPVRLVRSAPPVARARAALTSGVPAIRSAASELDTRCSAEPTMTHGISDLDRGEGHPPSASVRGLPAGRPGRSPMGSRIRAPMPVQGKDEHGRADLGHSHPDEQVGDAPHHRHQGEQDNSAPGHRGILARRIEPSFHACVVLANARSAGRPVTGKNTPGSRAVAPSAARSAGERPGGRPAGGGPGVATLSGWSRAATPAPR